MEGSEDPQAATQRVVVPYSYPEGRAPPLQGGLRLLAGGATLLVLGSAVWVVHLVLLIAAFAFLALGSMTRSAGPLVVGTLVAVIACVAVLPAGALTALGSFSLRAATRALASDPTATPDQRDRIGRASPAFLDGGGGLTLFTLISAISAATILMMGSGAPGITAQNAVRGIAVGIGIWVVASAFLIASAAHLTQALGHLSGVFWSHDFGPSPNLRAFSYLTSAGAALLVLSVSALGFASGPFSVGSLCFLGVGAAVAGFVAPAVGLYALLGLARFGYRILRAAHRMP